MLRYDQDLYEQQGNLHTVWHALVSVNNVTAPMGALDTQSDTRGHRVRKMGWFNATSLPQQAASISQVTIQCNGDF